MNESDVSKTDDEMENLEEYRELLLTAALDYWDRFHWITLPIQYLGDRTVPPKNWKEWYAEHPGAVQIREMFKAFWRRLDAIALVIASSSYTHLDIDANELIAVLSDHVSRSIAEGRLPGYQTGRGTQYLLRLNKRLDQVVPLNVPVANVTMHGGELRDGVAFSILPPSKHRRLEARYRWIKAPSDGDLVFDYKTLFRLPSVQRQIDSKFCAKFSTQKPAVESSRTMDRRLGSISIPSNGSISLSSDAIEQIVEETLPKMVGQRRVGMIKLVSRLMQLRSDWTEYEITNIASHWIRLAIAAGTTREKSESQTIKTVIYLFQHYWGSQTSMAERAFAISQSTEQFVEAGALIVRDRNGARDAIIKLATLCRTMSDLSVSDGVFFLSMHDAAKLIGKSPATVRSYLHKLIDDKLLECVLLTSPGRPGSPASHYRWLRHAVSIGATVP